MPLGVTTVMNRTGSPDRFATAWGPNAETADPTRLNGAAVIADLVGKFPVDADHHLVLGLMHM